jgi:hypothetical protein
MILKASNAWPGSLPRILSLKIGLMLPHGLSSEFRILLSSACLTTSQVSGLRFHDIHLHTHWFIDILLLSVASVSCTLCALTYIFELSTRFRNCAMGFIHSISATLFQCTQGRLWLPAQCFYYWPCWPLAITLFLTHSTISYFRYLACATICNIWPDNMILYIRKPI